MFFNGIMFLFVVQAVVRVASAVQTPPPNELLEWQLHQVAGNEAIASLAFKHVQ